MEYCAAGSVIDLIRICKRTLTEFEIATIAYNTLKGLEYLHENKKIHRYFSYPGISKEVTSYWTIRGILSLLTSEFRRS